MSKYFDQSNMFMEPDVTQHGSHMVMTNVVKPTKTKYLTLDTRFCDGYDLNTKANYTLTLPERVNNVRSMHLRNIEIPLTFYNISACLGNNTFKMKILLSETTIIIPDGQYTEAELESKINDLLSLEGPPFNDITIAITGKKATITNGGSINPCTITFDEAPINYLGVKSQAPSDSTISRLGWKLGYKKKSYEIAALEGKTAESFVYINGPRYLYLIVDEFTNGNPHSFLGLSTTSQLASQQILARISIDYNLYPFGSTFTAEKHSYSLSDIRRYSNEVDIQRLNIRLVDEFGKVIDLNGTDISMCLELEHL
jgi:hypothetical protein